MSRISFVEQEAHLFCRARSSPVCRARSSKHVSSFKAQGTHQTSTWNNSKRQWRSAIWNCTKGGDKPATWR
jgi:uncharacterized cupin superfamily protein